MNRRFSIVLLMALVGSQLPISAQANEIIKVAFGNALAPWVMPAKNEGIIIDIIETTMGPLGYEVQKVYLPYARRIKFYRQGLVNVVSDMNPNTIKHEHLQGFLSDTAYTYKNYAYSLKKRKEIINLKQ